MSEKVGSELDSGPHSQPLDEVVDRRIRPRPAQRCRPQVDEDVVGIQCPVFLVEVVGIQAHQLQAGRDCPRPCLGAGTVVVVTCSDGDRLLCDGEIFVAQPESLTHPNAGVEHQGKKQPVPQMLTSIQDRLNLLNS